MCVSNDDDDDDDDDSNNNNNNNNNNSNNNFSNNNNFIYQFLKRHYNMSKKCVKSSVLLQNIVIIYPRLF